MKQHLDKIKAYIEEDKEDKNLSIDVYLLMLSILFGSVLVLTPHIYIKNNIYYKSRNINKLYIQYQSLKDENKELRLTLEKIYFKQKNKGF